MFFKFIIFTFLGASLFAGAAAERDEEGRVIPGTRMIVHETQDEEEIDSVSLEAKESHMGFEAKESHMAFEAKEPHIGFEAGLEAKESHMAFEAGIYHTSHEGAFISPRIVTAHGGIVELQDRSIWVIADEDRYKTLDWLKSDKIVISANRDWFSNHQFRITNQATGVSVRCNLKYGPLYNGRYSHWIVAINFYTQEIFLEDGSIWQISGLDYSPFSRWQVNDTIIIGINDGFLESSKPNILINVQTLTFVRCVCL